jgi:SAM-dependent methyltransferase
LRHYLLHFETEIERQVGSLAAELPEGARILDAGAGEGQYQPHFHRHRYVGVDLGIGDSAWNYTSLDCLADLERLPFRDASFEAALNIVTLEHVKRPGAVLAEIGRVLKPGGVLLLVAPHEWEEHQQPHDYYRYTRYGLEYLLGEAGFAIRSLAPVGGMFRLLSRRLLNALQFFGGVWFFVAALFLAPLALVLPVFDRLDRNRNFTLGFVCYAVKR